MPLPPDNQDNIERLKHQIYQPGALVARVRRNRLTPLDEVGQRVWNEEKGPAAAPSHWWLRVLLVSVIFFLAATAAGLWITLRGGNVVSPDKIKIEVAGPVAVRAGEVISLQVVVANNNAAALDSADLIVSFPLGTRSPDRDRELPNLRLPLGSLAAGSSANQTVRATVFGGPGVVQKINFIVEYRIKGSNAIFDTGSVYEFMINTAPVLLTVDLPDEVAAHQTLNFSLEVAAEAEGPVTDIIIIADYPPGFSFGEGTPDPSYGDNIWRLGDLPAGGKRKISISGILVGEDQDVRSFRFVAGLADTKSDHQMAVPYNTLTKAVTITRPGVALDFSLNGNSKQIEYVAGSEDVLRAELSWINNLSTEITDAEIEVRLEGTVLDQTAVSSPGGFYQSGERKIVWSKRTDSKLSTLAAGSSGKVSFSFASLPLLIPGQASEPSPEITLFVAFRGRRVASGTTAEAVEATLARGVKINSIFQLGSAIGYSGGPFTNSGPLPPEVGEKTTYTVSWSVINSSNNVREAVVRATLPAYVEWLDQTAPASETITFDQASGEVVWNLGTVEAGRGVTAPAREVSFQIALLPSASQIGETPVLLAAPTLAGIDSFTNTRLISTKRPLDTNIVGDSVYRSGDERVAP